MYVCVCYFVTKRRQATTRKQITFDHKIVARHAYRKTDASRQSQGGDHSLHVVRNTDHGDGEAVDDG